MSDTNPSVAGDTSQVAGSGAAAIHAAWKEQKKRFEENWVRKDHKLIFIIQEGNQSITNEDANDIVTDIDLLDKRRPVDIILHTPGGNAMASARISEALVKRANTSAFVPLYAMSGGTEIALATQKIFLGPEASLGPYDLYYNGVSAWQLVSMARKLGKEAPIGLQIEAQEAEKALRDETGKSCARINRRHKGFLGWRKCTLAAHLTSGDLFHGERILFRQARSLGIRAYKGVPKSVFDLVTFRREQLRQLREIKTQKDNAQHLAWIGHRDLSGSGAKFSLKEAT